MKKKVRLIKINNFPDDGEFQKITLPLGYYVEGYLENDLVVGQPIILIRTNKNGKKCFGMVKTSNITEVTENTIKTKNSEYKIEYLH